MGINKKGQVTLFVILGLIALSAIFIFAFFQIKKESYFPKIQN
jgi:hypothetical protein